MNKLKDNIREHRLTEDADFGGYVNKQNLFGADFGPEA